MKTSSKDNWVKGSWISCVRCGKEYLQIEDDSHRCSKCDLLGRYVPEQDHQLALAKIKSLEIEIEKLKYPYRENL